MPPGLLAIAEHGQPARIRQGERIGGGRRRRGGADRGDLAGVEDRKRSAVLAIEQEDEALVGRPALGEIAREDADDLRTERALRKQGAGHDAEGVAAAEIDDAAQ
jgi:hypothetical protein